VLVPHPAQHPPQVCREGPSTCVISHHASVGTHAHPVHQCGEFCKVRQRMASVSPRPRCRQLRFMIQEHGSANVALLVRPTPGLMVTEVVTSVKNQPFLLICSRHEPGWTDKQFCHLSLLFM